MRWYTMKELGPQIILVQRGSPWNGTEEAGMDHCQIRCGIISVKQFPLWTCPQISLAGAGKFTFNTNTSTIAQQKVNEFMFKDDTIKPVLSGHSKRTPKLVFNTDYRLMQVKRIAECSKESILQYFRPSLSYHLSLRPLFCLFLSGCLRQGLL